MGVLGFRFVVRLIGGSAAVEVIDVEAKKGGRWKGGSVLARAFRILWECL